MAFPEFSLKLTEKTSGMILYPQMVNALLKQLSLPVGIDRFWILFKCENVQL